MRTTGWAAPLAILAGLVAAFHTAAAQKPSAPPSPDHGAIRVLLPLEGPDTEELGYPLQTVDRLAVRRLLVLKSFDALDTLLAAYADSAVRDYRFEYRLFDAYGAFAVCVPALADLLDEWVQQRAASAAALVARATFLIECGWKARGGGWAKDTPDQQFALMGVFLRGALNDLGAAQRLAPNSLVAYDNLMTIALVKGDAKLSRSLLDQALKIQPYSFLLRATHMYVLEPRWGGSYEAMGDFAAESAPYAAKNPRIKTLQGFADWDRARVLLMEERNVEAEQELREALRYGSLSRFSLERGRFYGRAGRNAAALADLNSALAQRPQYDDALFERARVEYALGGDASDTAQAAFFSQALRDIELAVKLDPTSAEFQDLLARYRLTIPGAPSHVAVRGGWSSGSVSSAALDGRIRAAAVNGRAPRAAFYDIAYPKDSAEMVEMGGYAVLLVTAVVHDSTEIPLARVYSRTVRGDQDLFRIATVASRVSPSDAPVIGTLGPFRVDAVYLFPVAARATEGDLLADFAAHRQAFALDRFDGKNAGLGWLARVPWPTGGPSPSAVWEIIRRQYPDLAPVLAGGEQ